MSVLEANHKDFKRGIVIGNCVHDGKDYLLIGHREIVTNHEHGDFTTGRKENVIRVLAEECNVYGKTVKKNGQQVRQKV